MYAVIKTGGKQYRVAAEDKIQIEKLPGEAGDIVEFTDVLMVASDGSVDVGAPFVAGATVAAEIIGQVRGPKVIIFKKHRRKHFRRKNGHRQDLMEVRITEILTDGRKPAGSARLATAEAPAATAPAATDKPAALPEQASATPPSTSGGDNLSLISGVGPKIKQSLHELGYTRFDQIAALTPDEIEAIETALKSKGRVARDEWIAQARELMDGKPPRAKADRAKPGKPQQE